MSVHKSVLLEESLEALNIQKGNIVVDATLGGGGHSREILKRVGTEGKLIALDLDEKAIHNCSFKKEPNVFLVKDNFINLKKILTELKVKKVDAILADLGWSSDQLKGTGLSFQENEALDMRFSKDQELSAQQIINEYSQEKLGKILKEYGEERFWKSISQKIVISRKIKKIETTKELVTIIQQAVSPQYRYGRIHPATKTFQALRIEVNRELDNLSNFLIQSIDVLSLGGRLAVISFHSLEDRIIKRTLRENARGGIFTDVITGKKIVQVAPSIKLITKKPLRPSEEEIKSNPRARSAKLRVGEKIVKS